MRARRTFLKFTLAAVVGAVCAPVRALFGASDALVKTVGVRPVGAAALRVVPADEKIIRTFYGEGWNRGNRAVFGQHPELAECQKTFDHFRGAFPDLRITIASIESQGAETHVRWTAQGTHRGALDGVKATGRRVNVAGLTRMKLAEGKIVWTAAEWDQNALLRQLGAKVGG